jgi:hypothetical protein
MAGGVLRAVLGYVPYSQLQKHEQLVGLFGGPSGEDLASGD